MEKLAIVRTNPEQGKLVKVEFRGEDYHLAKGEFPFSLWIQFEKLVKDGMESRARTETKETRRIEVEFRIPAQLPTPDEAEARAKRSLELGSIPGRKQREAQKEGDE